MVDLEKKESQQSVRTPAAGIGDSYAQPSPVYAHLQSFVFRFAHFPPHHSHRLQPERAGKQQPTMVTLVLQVVAPAGHTVELHDLGHCVGMQVLSQTSNMLAVATLPTITDATKQKHKSNGKTTRFIGSPFAVKTIAGRKPVSHPDDSQGNGASLD